MSRLLLSIIFGLFPPFIYFIFLAVISFCLESLNVNYEPTFLTEIEFLGEPAPGVLFLPFLIPFYFDSILKHYGILPWLFDTVLFRASSLIAFNWILGGIFLYWILGKFKRFRKKETTYSETPPPPDLFI